MKRSLRPIVVGAGTIALSVAFAAAAPGRVIGGTHELAAFVIWSIPLGAILGFFAIRPRFLRFPHWGRVVASATFGLLAGFVLTFLGWMIVGGWMLAWDFPVLYCWALAGSLGAVAAASISGAIRFRQSPAGVAAALLPLAALAWFGARPDPAVLIVYRDEPGRHVAQFVLDSVLSVPHSSGHGRDIRWPHTSYRLTATADGQTAALIGLRKAQHRDSIRQVLRGHPMVMSVTDTVIPR